MRILCIDDDPVYAKEVREWLETRAFLVKWTHVLTLDLGIAALHEAAAAGDPYHVLLIDLLLPGETAGLYRIPKLREDFPGLTIIGLTAATDFDEETLALGQKLFIAKKSQAEDLVVKRLTAFLEYYEPKDGGRGKRGTEE